MTPARPNDPRLLELDRLAKRAGCVLLRWKLFSEMRRASAIALTGMFAGPLLLLIAAQVSPHPVSPWALAGSALLGPVLYVLHRVAWALWNYRPARRAGLALFDARLEASDRLLAADEFLHEADASSGFKQAAVDDAGKYIRSALGLALAPRALPDWHFKPASLPGVLAAAVIAALLSLQTYPSRPGLAHLDPPVSLTGGERPAADKTARHEVARRRVVDARDRQQQNEVEEELTQQQTQSAQRPADDAHSAQGKTASSSPAAAKSASTASSSAGESSNEKSSTQSKPQDTAAARANSKPTAPAAKRGERKPQENRLAMEPTSGEGSASTSASSASPLELPERADKSDPVARLDDPAAEADEADREEKSSGLTTPSLPDRKAPVDRNASTRPGGNAVRADANGRGGPGGLKKTRGVPSMILGIPVADRVLGMPNPGSAKVTRERARPSVEARSASDAQQRLARADPTGEVLHPHLLPWMQNVIRDYFLAAHGQTDPDAASPSRELDKSGNQGKSK
ncbi:MAG: hypothetical protein WDO56_14880 [Gammaproteobacteria bacterium]